MRFRRRHASTVVTPPVGSVEPEVADPFEARQAEIEVELTRAAGGASLCAISRSTGSVPAAKYFEGRLAAITEVRRAVKRGAEPQAAVVAAAASWHGALHRGRARDAGPDWMAYWAGGVDELDDLSASGGTAEV